MSNMGMIILLSLSLTSALLFGWVGAQPVGRFELNSEKYNVTFRVSEGAVALQFYCDGRLVLNDTGYPSNGLKLLPIGDNRYTIDQVSQSLSSIDSWYTQIESLNKRKAGIPTRFK
ncbi:hypothetical protein FOZ62_004190, partial [Perkinsus olseni]